jgi:hypothetical protein
MASHISLVPAGVTSDHGLSYKLRHRLFPVEAYVLTNELWIPLPFIVTSV